MTTRDEAILVAYKKVSMDNHILGTSCSEDKLRQLAENQVNYFTSLGMLKLEEPKSAENKFADILVDYFPGPEVDAVWQRMDDANLKIVSK